MSEHRPSNNKNGKKSSYGSVPVRTRSNSRPGSGGKTNIKPAVKPSGKPGGIPISKTGSRPIARSNGKSKYETARKPKLPTPVIITNVLMICVILSICGVIFAIAFNNAKYDKDDASRNQRGESTVSSVVQSVASEPQSSAGASSAEPVSSVAVSTANSGGTDDPVTPPDGSFDKEYFKDDLFIGDSIFTGLYLYGYLDRKSVAAMVGYTAYGAQVTAFDETFFKGSAVDYAKSLQPKRIIIMLGPNSLSAQTDFDDFENGYRGLINALKRDCPNSTICAVSVPPVTANSSSASYTGVTNTIINTANSRIKNLTNELGVMYYDFNSVLKDANGYFKDEYAEADGMHFLGATYPVLLSGLQKALGQ